MIPTNRTLYAFFSQYPSLVIRGGACAVRMPAYRDNALVTPSSGTYSLIAPGGAILVNAASVTIVDSIATYTIPSGTLPATLEPLGEGWQEEWSLVMPDSSVPYVVRRTAALARCTVYPSISEVIDFEALYPGIGVYRVGSVTTFQPQIDMAWGMLMERIITEGKLPYTVRTPDALRMPHLHLSLALVFGGWTLGADAANWVAREEKHLKAYEQAWAAVTWQQDTAQTGQVDDPSSRSKGAVFVQVNAAPHPNSSQGWRAVTRRWL